VLADRSEANAGAAGEVMANVGYQVSVATVEVSSRETVDALVGKATGIGAIVGLIHVGYRRMIDGSVAKRAGTPDEVAAVGALLMGPDGGFITGSDFLMDGGVTAA
jgi:NAD(P)-dependent dehydrogenase (short-subunit alcohol dehydrogenase family)